MKRCFLQSKNIHSDRNKKGYKPLALQVMKERRSMPRDFVIFEDLRVQTLAREDPKSRVEKDLHLVKPETYADLILF